MKRRYMLIDGDKHFDDGQCLPMNTKIMLTYYHRRIYPIISVSFSQFYNFVTPLELSLFLFLYLYIMLLYISVFYIQPWGPCWLCRYRSMLFIYTFNMAWIIIYQIILFLKITFTMILCILIYKCKVMCTLFYYFIINLHNVIYLFFTYCTVL